MVDDAAERSFGAELMRRHGPPFGVGSVHALSEEYTSFMEDVAAILGVRISDAGDPAATLLEALREALGVTQSQDEVKAAEKLRDTIAERRAQHEDAGGADEEDERY